MIESSRRFWSKVVKTRRCWFWRGCIVRGLGRARFEGKQQLARRVAYQLTIGKIPLGLRLAQTCRNRTCISPYHLKLHFWLRINTRGNCHLWTGTQRHGSGRVRFRGRQIDPRRLAYMLSVGSIPAGEAVSNTCRNPLCCRPAHLKLGKNYRAADPDPMMRRFWANVEETDEGCWPWRGSTLSSGYGRVRIDGKMRLAHHVMYELSTGKVPEGHYIKQRCKHRACVRPEHLIATPAGTLTANMVRLIRSALTLHLTVAEIAERFGTTASHVRRIAAGTYRVGREAV